MLIYLASAQASGAARRAGAGGVVMSLRVQGVVRGAAGGAVRITVQVRRGSHWVTVRTAHATVTRDGGFTCDRAALAHGSYRVRATFLGTPNVGSSLSTYRRFTLS